MAIPPPSPLHTLRVHQQPVLALFVSSDNERIYSGDGKGRVVVTSTRSLRAIANWEAHKEGLLGIEEYGDNVITFVYFHQRYLELMAHRLFFRQSWQGQQDSRMAASNGIGIHPTGRGSVFDRSTSPSAVLFLGRQCTELLSILSSSETQFR